MGGVAVVTDSSAGIPSDLVDELGISVVPVDVLVDGVVLPQGGSLDLAQAVRDGVKVTTSRSTPEAFERVFAALADQGFDQVVVATLSSKLSGTFESALMAGRVSAIPVSVCDSLSVGLALGFPVINAAQVARAGASGPEVLEVLESGVRQSQVFFYVHSLEYLKRGGRISPTSALVGTALSVKPIMSITNGEVVLKEKVRTKAKALAELVRLAVESAQSREHPLIGLQYFGDRILVDQCAVMLGEQLPDARLLVSEVSPVIGVHAGPGLVGISISSGVGD